MALDGSHILVGSFAKAPHLGAAAEPWSEGPPRPTQTELGLDLAALLTDKAAPKESSPTQGGLLADFCLQWQHGLTMLRIKTAVVSSHGPHDAISVNNCILDGGPKIMQLNFLEEMKSCVDREDVCLSLAQQGLWGLVADPLSLTAPPSECARGFLGCGTSRPLPFRNTFRL